MEKLVDILEKSRGRSPEELVTMYKSMTPREIEESVYGALEERRQRQERMKLKSEMLKGKKAPER